jgi:hypothetical protein
LSPHIQAARSATAFFFFFFFEQNHQASLDK